jgi:SAM-dependent methyltransferase
MAQITTGVRAVLSSPAIYSSFQALMGARRFRTNFADAFVRPHAGMRILDIGCGPADILAYLPGVDYWGFDISEAYIAKAKATFGERGRFHCKHLEREDLARLPRFDVAIAIGLLHHLDDPVAREVIALARDALRPGGRLVTVDPCLDPSQNFVSRFLVSNDRGQNVRAREGYESLARGVFARVHAQVRHQAWIPYTHCIMQCSVEG